MTSPTGSPTPANNSNIIIQKFASWRITIPIAIVAFAGTAMHGSGWYFESPVLAACFWLPVISVLYLNVLALSITRISIPFLAFSLVRVFVFGLSVNAFWPESTLDTTFAAIVVFELVGVVTSLASLFITSRKSRRFAIPVGVVWTCLATYALASAFAFGSSKTLIDTQPDTHGSATHELWESQGFLTTHQQEFKVSQFGPLVKRESVGPEVKTGGL